MQIVHNIYSKLRFYLNIHYYEILNTCPGSTPNTYIWIACTFDAPQLCNTIHIRMKVIFYDVVTWFIWYGLHGNCFYILFLCCIGLF